MFYKVIEHNILYKIDHFGSEITKIHPPGHTK